MKLTFWSGHSFRILYNLKVHEYLTNQSNRFVLNIRRASIYGGIYIRNADKKLDSINFNDLAYNFTF